MRISIMASGISGSDDVRCPEMKFGFDCPHLLSNMNTIRLLFALDMSSMFGYNRV